MFDLPQTRYAKAPEGDVAYQVVGDGPRDLVVVPGWFSHLDLQWDDPPWRAFITELASFARVILYDKRGTGLSDPVDGAPTLQSRADDLLAVIDAAESQTAGVVRILRRRSDQPVVCRHIPGTSQLLDSLWDWGGSTGFGSACPR